MDDTQIQEVVRRGDLDELLRVIDALCDARAWDALATLRERCQRAHETGRQLWPAASHAAYRLALGAPGPWAAGVLSDDALAFGLGPLPEVAAQSHTWHELAPHLSPNAAAVIAAHERVMRGEDLADAEVLGPAVLDLPLQLVDWEPDYCLAEYRDEKADFPSPAVSGYSPLTLPNAPAVRERDEVCDALLDLARVWTTQSNGRADAVAVDGTALDAVAALGPREARGVEIDLGLALALMAWTGASGGAHGRRPGAAAGRFAAWWLSGALTASLDTWPPDPEELGRRLEALRFLAWDAAEPSTGWRLQLAIEDPARQRAWAIAALDAA
jgi:hypothetical protein